MAKNDPAPKKQRWYHAVITAYKQTAPHDKALTPLLIGVAAGVLGLSVVIGLLFGNIPALVYAIIFGLLAAALADMYLLTRRFEKVAFARMEGTLGGSVAVAGSIRSGWSFDDNPVAVDPKGRAIVFRGVGKGGVVLLVEGTAIGRKLVETETRRISKLIPGVPISPIYVGTGEGQVPLRKLVPTIRKRKSVLSRREREAVAARLRAIGGQKLPVPKGVDPMRARPDRKALRGR